MWRAIASRRLMYGAHALFSLAAFLASLLTGFAREAGAGPVAVLPLAALALGVAALGSLSVAGTAHAATRTGTSTGPDDASSSAAIRAIAALAVLCALAFLIEDAVQNWSALHLEHDLLSPPEIGGAGPAVFAGAMFLGRSAGQWLGARYTDRALLTGGALAAAAGLAASALTAEPIVALAGFAVGGAASRWLRRHSLLARAASSIRAGAVPPSRLSRAWATWASWWAPRWWAWSRNCRPAGGVRRPGRVAGCRARRRLVLLRASTRRAFVVGEELLKTGRADP